MHRIFAVPFFQREVLSPPKFSPGLLTITPIWFLRQHVHSQPNQSSPEASAQVNTSQRSQTPHLHVETQDWKAIPEKASKMTEGFLFYAYKQIFRSDY